MLLRGRSIETGLGMEVEAREDRIASIEILPEKRGEGPGLPGDLWLLPGLIDIQVNGYGGFDFGSPEAAAQTVRLGWREGVTQICPTVTTGSPEAMQAALRAIAEACEDPLIGASVPAIHIEGPFLSPEDGPRGAHPLEYIRRPDWDEFRRWQDAAVGRVGLVTLAPEVPGALEFIEKVTDTGVQVALGHTGADALTIRRAIAAGACLSTHLGNGAHALLPRHPNYIWEQAAADDLWATLILDGHHLPPPVAKTLIRCKGVDRSILISDATSLAGLPPGRYGDAEVSEDLRCSLVGTPYLAGSVISLRHGVSNAVLFAHVSPAQAVYMASLQPARFLGLESRLGRLSVGREASLIACRWQPYLGDLEILETVVAGQRVYRAEE
ncbi:MAG: amidohydrolase family protein [Armatimonadetes bacterium]|nr:amidohydrolase family protein [Armatimonadota bacterium]